MKRSTKLLTLCASVILAAVLFLTMRPPTPEMIPVPPPPEPRPSAPPPPITEAAPTAVAAIPAPSPRIETPPEAGVRAFRIKVCDVGTGEGIPGIELQASQPDNESRIYITNAAGEFQIEGRMPAGFSSSEVKVVTMERGSGEQEFVLWVHRLMQLDIQVVGTSRVKTLDFDKVSLLLLAGEQKDGRSSLSRVKRTTWINSHRLERMELPAPDASGKLRAMVPMLPGYRVSASAPGWQSAVEEIPYRKSPSSRVRLELTKESFTLSGTLTDADGNSLPNVTVVAYIVVEMPYDQVDKAAFRSVGHGYTYTTKKAENRAVVCYRSGGKTDSRGRFEFEARVAGQLTLVARPRGPFRHIIQEAGPLNGDTSDLELVARSHEGTVTITRNGAPLAGEKVTVSDIQDWHFNPSFGATLDVRGELTSAGFIRGHEYSLYRKIDRLKNYYLVWNDQRRIELSDLPNLPASIRALQGK